MRSPDGRYTLIFNGEIYNHRELRQELAELFVFRSESDSETLLYALAHWGAEALKRLNGIFAFAFYDSLTRSVLIARDHLGVKPLYYVADSKFFVFASELKALRAVADFSTELDYGAIFSAVSLLWVPGPQTPFAAVKKLSPGTALSISLDDIGRVDYQRFYEIPFRGEYDRRSRTEIIAEFRDRLSLAVKRQLLSDVPVGFFLSGGMDSSSLVALAAAGGESLTAFTIQGDETFDREGFAADSRYARLVAEQMGVKLIGVPASSDIVNEFDKMIFHLDEPQADLAPLHVLNISRAAKASGIKVLISGAGGDDLLSGYRRHQFALLQSVVDLIPGGVRNFVAELAQRSGQPGGFRRIIKMLECLKGDRRERLCRTMLWGVPSHLHGLLAPEIREVIEPDEPLEHLRGVMEVLGAEQNDLNRLLFLDLKTFLPDHNLNYTDKMGMACGVEIRVPFLDIDLVNFCARIPPSFKHNLFQMKSILRDAMRGVVPEPVLRRAKTGFGVPIRDWVRNEFREIISERLAPARLRQQGLFDPAAVTELIRATLYSRYDGAYTIIALLAVESWVRQFRDTPPKP
jgi:asparagine synthase (glutamine-hydrolysing)